jgi:dihydrofolate reductase
MRKLVTGTFLTLDGVYQAPGGPDEDREGGFEHGGWSVNYWDEGMGQAVTELTQRADALLLGRKTYDIFVAHWPNVGDEDPIAAKLNSVQKYVASRTLGEVNWNNATLLRGDAADEVRRLKEEGSGEIHVSGSGDLIQTLLKNDLVDEFTILTFPVVVGSGKRLFGTGALPGALRLVDSKTSSTGVTINTYVRAGAIEYGEFEVDEQGEAAALWAEAEARRPTTASLLTEGD